MSELLGRQIGDYRLTRLLGKGGMGEVYEATQGTLERVVALKVLSEGHPAEFTQRFLNEARVHSRLSHPNIVRLYDFFEFEGRPCIVMELVRGQSLDERVAQRQRLPVEEALHIFTELVAAAAHVHDMGIVHRDLKTNNIRITPGGDVKLLDFGIAKSSDLPRMTEAGLFVGTLQYSSPEQLRGENVDFRSDIWALGVVFYEMLTGRLPFPADSVGNLLEHVNRGEVTPISSVRSDVPREMETLILRCLAPKARDRARSTQSLLDAARRMQQGEPPDLSQAGVRAFDLPMGADTFIGRVKDTFGRWQQALPGFGALPSVDPARALRTAGILAAVVVAGIVFNWAIARGPAEQPTPSDVRLARVLIDSPGGAAEVFVDGKSVGRTPWRAELPVGQSVDVVLRRNGYRERAAHFEVNESGNEYSYPLQRSR